MKKLILTMCDNHKKVKLMKVMLLFVWVLCCTSASQATSSRDGSTSGGRRCVRNIVRYPNAFETTSETILSTTSYPDGIHMHHELDHVTPNLHMAQQLHSSTTCVACPKETPLANRTKTNMKQKDDLYTATIFLPPWLNDEDHTLFSIASELLQKSMRVTLLHVYSFIPNTDDTTSSQLSRDDHELFLHETFTSIILSFLPCKLEHIVQDRLSIQMEPILGREVELGQQGEVKYPTERGQVVCPFPPNSPYDTCAMELAPRIYQTLRFHYIRVYHPEERRAALQSIFVMGAEDAGGVTFAEKLKLTLVLIASPNLLDLITEKEASILDDANRHKHSRGRWRKFITERVKSLFLTGEFIRLNKMRYGLDLPYLHNPADYFDRAAAVIVNSSPKLEYNRKLPYHVHLVGEFIPRCVPCKYPDENSTSILNSISTLSAPRQPMQPGHMDYITENVTKAVTVIIGPMDLRISESRALVRALSFVRSELQSYTAGVCYKEEDSDDDCGLNLFGGPFASMPKADFELFVKDTCQRKNAAAKTLCKMSLEMAAFNVVWLLSSKEHQQNIPEALPGFISLEEEQLLIDIAARHPQTSLIISDCSDISSDWRDSIILGIPVMCIPTRYDRRNVAETIGALEIRHGMIQVKRNTREISSVLPKMLYGVQSERLREELLSHYEVDLDSYVYVASSEVYNPLWEMRAVGDLFLSAGGLPRAATMIRKAAKFQRRAGNWSTKYRKKFSKALDRTKTAPPDKKIWIESIVLCLAWFFVLLASCFFLNAWSIVFPTWFRRFFQQQFSRDSTDQVLEAEQAKKYFIIWLNTLDWKFGSAPFGQYVGEKREENGVTKEATAENGQLQNQVRKEGTTNNTRKRRATRRR